MTSSRQPLTSHKIDDMNELADTITNTQSGRTNCKKCPKRCPSRLPRMGLLISLILFLLIGKSKATSSTKLSGLNGAKRLSQTLDAISLSNRDLLDVKTVLLPLRKKDFIKQNSTGVFKGSWKSITDTEVLPSRTTFM